MDKKRLLQIWDCFNHLAFKRFPAKHVIYYTEHLIDLPRDRDALKIF